ncbi:hypothetical protein [Paenibacillus polymyxa]|uniref:hypothetical protein n=1 Tax=Paenibacillus polymyxa TaxID=1406 RepID=UPI0004BC06EB|nr:hypothetical protein [Paenibacillus polymyxa]
MNNGFNIQTFKDRYFLSLPTQGGELNEIKSFDFFYKKFKEYFGVTLKEFRDNPISKSI